MRSRSAHAQLAELDRLRAEDFKKALAADLILDSRDIDAWMTGDRPAELLCPPARKTLSGMGRLVVG